MIVEFKFTIDKSKNIKELRKIVKDYRTFDSLQVFKILVIGFLAFNIQLINMPNNNRGIQVKKNSK